MSTSMSKSNEACDSTIEDYVPERDYEAVSKIHEQQRFALPRPGFMCASKIVKLYGKVVGFGMLKVYPEAFIMIDQELSTRDKVALLKELMAAGIEHCREAEADEMMVFVEDDFAQILEKHFGFQRSKGIAMSINLRSRDAESKG